MANRRVTLTTIAATLGLSPATVSRALTNKPGVNQETRARVLEAADLLKYKGSETKQQSRQSQVSGTSILLAIPPDSEYAAEFWFQVISGADAEAERLGYRLITKPIEAETPLSAEALLSRDIIGVIAISHLARPLAQAYEQLNVPVSLISHPHPTDTVDTITTANYQGGFMVGNYLLSLGHKSLAFLSPKDATPSHPERLRGFREAIELAPDAELHERQVDPNMFNKTLESVLQDLFATRQTISAIFCADDHIALSAMLILKRFDVVIPDDISIVGYTDSRQASQAVPKLTTVRSPAAELGVAAMQNLQRHIVDGRKGPLRHLMVTPELIIRDSTGRNQRDTRPQLDRFVTHSL